MVTVEIGRDHPPVEFEGELIAEQARREGQRWPEFRIWKLTGGGYMAQRVGCSNVYHTAGTRCSTKQRSQRGSPATVEDLPDDAEPCEICNPPYPEDLRDDEQVRFEFPRSSMRRYRTARQVIKFFTLWRDPDTQETVQRVTKPVQALLEQAAAADPAFAADGLTREGIEPLEQGADHGTEHAGHHAGGSLSETG